MSAYTDACLVEQHGMAVLLPFLESRAWRGPSDPCCQGWPASRPRHSARWTGNLYLEVWSNKNLDDRGSLSCFANRPLFAHWRDKSVR